MRSPMNKENRHTTRTVVAKRGSVVLAPVPTAREPRRPRSQQTDAVLQLVTAVKDQGKHGTCWAFSATGVLEGINAMRPGHQLTSLSEQYVLRQTFS